MTTKEILDKYNSMLREKHGQNITVKIKKVPRETKYFFTSRKYGNSISFNTIEEAYKEADIYLCGVGEWW
jgi:hypothetical protein